MGTGFTSVLSAVWDGIATVVTSISSEPLLLIPVGLTFAGGVIGLTKGLMGTRRRRR